MCDTLLTKVGKDTVFLKNSDRAANEPNLVVYSPARIAEGDVECTYISIPDKDSFATVLYKPAWIWGAEMGVNEKGVVIGNEAVFTKSKSKKKPSLIGMDFLRLALERGDSAKAAAQVIIDLLGEYGQGGNCGFDKKFFYDNSYLIADRSSSYILETAGKDWVLKKVDDKANISNRLSITTNFDDCSKEGNFAKRHTNKTITAFSGAKIRQKQGSKALKKARDLKDCFGVLRCHKTKSYKKLFNKGSVKSVCMHANAFGDHTTGSMVAVLREDFVSIWVTGSSTPCLSVFKPIYLSPKCNSPMFDNERAAAGYWLKRELLNRAIFAGYIDIARHKKQINELENKFLAEERRLIECGASIEEFVQFSENCSFEEHEFIDSYDKIVNGFNDLCLPPKWRKRNKKLGINMFYGLKPHKKSKKKDLKILDDVKKEIKADAKKITKAELKQQKKELSKQNKEYKKNKKVQDAIIDKKAQQKADEMFKEKQKEQKAKDKKKQKKLKKKRK